jgi:hypothetical protein
MLQLRIDGAELGVTVGFLAVVWVFFSLFVYLLWYRFLRERIVKLTNPMLKAVMIIAFALLVALVLFAVFFSQTHSSFEATYKFPADLAYNYLSG